MTSQLKSRAGNRLSYRTLAAARGRPPAGVTVSSIEGARRSHVSAMRHSGGQPSRGRMRSSCFAARLPRQE